MKTDIVAEVTAKLIQEPWFLSAHAARDHGGERVEVLVNRQLYSGDPLPRKLGDVYLIIRKVDGPNPEAS